MAGVAGAVLSGGDGLPAPMPVIRSDDARTFDVAALGEPLIEFSQTPGTNDWCQGFGGDTSNFAIAAQRAGARCTYLSRLGDEDFGHALLALWEREGVECGAVELDPHQPTGLYFIRYDERGHTFSYRRAGSAATGMRLTDAFRARIRASRWLHVSGISQAISERACDTVFEAIEFARAHGTRISYDLNFRARLWPAARAAAIARATLPYCDLFLPSIDEAQVLFESTDPARLSDWAISAGARSVAVKLGAAGAWVANPETALAIAAHPVRAIDATGAGDCFGGVMVARLIAGDTLAAAAHAATVAAAIATTGRGAIDPLPRWADIAQHLPPVAGLRLAHGADG